MLRDAVRLMRPRDWIKQVFVLLPVPFGLADGAQLDPVRFALGVFAFCLVSSAAYAYDDALDAELDRQHPEKRNRPVAAGRIREAQARRLAAALLVLAVLLGLLAGGQHAARLIALYAGLNLVYGHFAKHVALLDVFAGADTPGTLGIALADLDRDGRIDVVQAQGEHPEATEERIYMGTGLPADTLPPVIGPVDVIDAEGERVIRVRIHDRKSPSLAAEWQDVSLVWTSGAETGPPGDAERRRTPLTWYGEYLWRGTVPPDARGVRVCATDLAGNEACAEVGGD